MSLVERGEQAVKESSCWGLGGTRDKGRTVHAGAASVVLRGFAVEASGDHSDVQGSVDGLNE